MKTVRIGIFIIITILVIILFIKNNKTPKSTLVCGQKFIEPTDFTQGYYLVSCEAIVRDGDCSFQGFDFIKGESFCK